MAAIYRLQVTDPNKPKQGSLTLSFLKRADQLTAVNHLVKAGYDVSVEPAIEVCNSEQQAVQLADLFFGNFVK